MAAPHPDAPRIAVVGHIEWVDFVSLPRYPEEGEVAHAAHWSARVGGGGGVAAVVLAEMGAEVDFFLALGRDAPGEATVAQLRERGVRPHVAWRDTMTRRAITYLTAGGERTIVTIGERLEPLGSDGLPWERLRDADAVYFTAGDAGALVHARAARVLTATPRGREALEHSSVTMDALIYSDEDADERGWAQRLSGRAAPDGGHRGCRGRVVVGGLLGPLGARRASGARAGRLRLRRLVRGRVHLRAGSRLDGERGGGAGGAAGGAHAHAGRRSLTWFCVPACLPCHIGDGKPAHSCTGVHASDCAHRGDSKPGGHVP